MAAGLLAAPAVRAQSWPSKPIRLIVPFPPGGSTDAVGRILAPLVGEQLRQSIVVENRAGAGGMIGADAVAKAAPDGHTVGIASQGGLVVNARLYPNRPYDPTRDLAPITKLIDSPFVLVVNRGAAARDLREFLALARARPGAMSIGHGGNGTLMHLSAELLNQMAGIQVLPVAYRGTAPAGAAATGGEVEAAVLDVPTALSLLQEGGALQALAVTGSERVPLLPGVPTAAEAGVPGYETVGWFGLVAPAATPPPVLDRLNAVFVAALRDLAVRQRLQAIGCEPRPLSAREFSDSIRAESIKWGNVVERANIRPD